MKLPVIPATLAARSLSARSQNHIVNDSNPAQVVMTNNGHVYLSSYDGKEFTTTMNATVAGSPSWVQFVEPNLLYAVNENGADMSIFHLSLNGSGGALEGPVVTANGSTGVVHIQLSQDGSRMVGAGYGAGAIDVWDTSDGKLELLKTIPSDGALGPDQEAAHPHQAVLDPTGRYFAVNDLGTDQILVLDSKDDAWTVSPVQVKPEGCGPRHGVFYPAGAKEASHYILACELGNLVVVYELAYGQDGVDFTEVNSVSTYAANATIAEKAAAGEIVLSPDNRNLYVSNRLTGADSDTIAHFTIPADGPKSLAYVDETPTGGVLPRMFSLTADAKEILVGNQNGPAGVVALALNEDGSIAKTPKASLDVSVFGGKEFGPPFVQQIR